jgi:hypothetical protein
MPIHRSKPIACLAALAMVVACPLFAQHAISPPKVGEHTVGEDYFLANYTQLLGYWNTVVKQTDRMQLVEYGKTAEGRPMILAIITSPANLKNLARYQQISQRLARAEGLTDQQAHQLASEGKSVVWIDAGLHATETVNAQALFPETYDLLSRTDPETLRILNDDILLLTCINPDGMELVANWYMRESDPAARNLNIPRLYQKYVGHDDNRDSYIANQPETEAVNRQMYIEWIPQIMFNQHQTGPAGSVLFFAPFRDPFNYNQDPLVPIGIDLVSAAVHDRFLAEGKPGAVMRTGAPYSTWFNGGDRTMTGFHNQIGLLAEIIGSPQPVSIPVVASKLLPMADNPWPIGPRQEWHQSQSIEYLITADRAILDIASRLREEFLFRIYRAGRNSIERGSMDYWTITPKRVAALEALAGVAPGGGEAAPAGDTGQAFGGRGGIPVQYWDQLHSKESRDPRGYIIPSDQADFPTATKFVNALLKGGIEVERATADFTVAGKRYLAGSYVIMAAQAFRPHLRDMLEPQDHPNDFQYPGGPPKPPYDITGYTLAFQMGVEFDRILDGFEGPFQKIDGLLKPPAGRVTPGSAGYLLSHRMNDAFTGTTRLLAAGQDVYWLKQEFRAEGKTYPAGTIYIPAKPSTPALVRALASELGLNFSGTTVQPQGEAFKLRPVRIGLWDRYGGSQDSGHIRWMFEQAFPTPYELVYAPALDAGGLNGKYDVLIFPDGAIPGESGRGVRGGGGGGGGRGAAGRGGRGRGNIPEEYRSEIGNVTLATTGPQLRSFVEGGGTVVAIGGSTGFGSYLGLPVTSALTQTVDGNARRLPNTKFYIPGSVLEASVDTSLPIAYGLPPKVDVFYYNSPAFRLAKDAAGSNTQRIAWFASPDPLRSGWAWGQQYLNGAVAAVESDVGKGKVYLFGPEITFRGQPHGTFKFLFNAIYLAGASSVTLP